MEFETTCRGGRPGGGEFSIASLGFATDSSGHKEDAEKEEEDSFIFLFCDQLRTHKCLLTKMSMIRDPQPPLK